MYHSWAMLRAPTLTSPVCPPAAAPSYGVCLLRPIRTVRAGLPAPFASLGRLLSSHQAIVRVSAAAIVFTLIVVFSQQAPTQAVPEASRSIAPSLLPQTIAIGLPTDEAVRVTFEEPMDHSSVEAALELTPAGDATLAWNADSTELSVAPAGLWRTDQSYTIVVDGSATTAAGQSLAGPRRYAFSTQAAPAIASFEVDLAGVDLPVADASEAAFARVDHAVAGEAMLTTSETAREVSAASSIRINFSTAMNRSSTRDAFSIAPAVAGEITWEGDELIFTPGQRLEPGGRYTISLVGARDGAGNELGGKVNFTFVVRATPQIVRTTPELGAQGVEPGTVEMWFSQPMDVEATNAAFGLTDTTTGRLVAGRLNWNETATQLVYSPDRALAGGRTFEVALGPGAVDAAGNSMTAEWSFTTEEGPAPAPTPAPAHGAQRAAGGTPAAPAPAAPAPAAVAFVPVAASGLEGYGLNQINSARAAYGLPPLALDPTMSAVAAAHAWDQLNYGYYSHTGRDGSSVRTRLAAAGVAYSAAGENQCHAMMGMGAQGTMDWCHGVFMAEPWPGYWNHIGNILSSRYTRVGIGVADNGSRVVITWDFAN